MNRMGWTGGRWGADLGSVMPALEDTGFHDRIDEPKSCPVNPVNPAGPGPSVRWICIAEPMIRSVSCSCCIERAGNVESG